MRDKTFLIMAGGTGGHVFPALATAKGLMARNDRVVWLGSVGGMEEKVVASEGIEFHGISVKGIRGKGKLTKLFAPIKLLNAVYQAIKVLLKVKPDAVLGMGGFASGPGGLAAKLLGKPLLIHEQNAAAGMTNRLLARIADSVMSAFPNAFKAASVNNRLKLTGNPIREDLCELYYRPGKDTDRGDSEPLRILILGGSLGAASLNDTVPQAIALLGENIKPEVWHQTGKNKLADVAKVYKEASIKANVSEFITDMAEAYRWADFVICRAGALTISELCVSGLGAILVPYPYAVDDHQTLNAQFMVNAGAAWLMPQSELSAKALSETLKPLCSKPARLEHLSKAARKLAKADATEQVVNECRRVCYV